MIEVKDLRVDFWLPGKRLQAVPAPSDWAKEVEGWREVAAVASMVASMVALIVARAAAGHTPESRSEEEGCMLPVSLFSQSWLPYLFPWVQLVGLRAHQSNSALHSCTYLHNLVAIAADSLLLSYASEKFLWSYKKVSIELYSKAPTHHQ